MAVSIDDHIDLWDIAYLAQHLRDADRDELDASSGDDPFDILVDSVRVSTHAAVAVKDGRPIAMFGVTPLSMLSGRGIPWLLGTEEVYNEIATVTREARKFVARVRVVYPELVNYVDARNLHAVRWLTFMGFRLHSPTPFGRFGMPFHRFEMGPDV